MRQHRPRRRGIRGEPSRRAPSPPGGVRRAAPGGGGAGQAAALAPAPLRPPVLGRRGVREPFKLRRRGLTSARLRGAAGGRRRRAGNIRPPPARPAPIRPHPAPFTHPPCFNTAGFSSGDPPPTVGLTRRGSGGRQPLAPFLGLGCERGRSLKAARR